MPKTMKTALAVLMTLLICLAGAPRGSLARNEGAPMGNLPAFSGGGTEDDPFLIASGQELRLLAASVNSGEGYSGHFFLLTADIELGGSLWTPIGDGAAGESGQNAFRGSFSGGGHTVSGVETADTLLIAGLFGMTQGGAVHDITIESAAINSAGAAGGAIGRAEGTEIHNIVFSGEVHGQSSVGGIAGDITGGSIANCEVRAELTGANGTGGVAGGADGAVISNCEAEAAVQGTRYAGGVAGIAGNTRFEGCTAHGSIAAQCYAGGVCGFLFDCSIEASSSSVCIECGDRGGGMAGVAQTTGFSRCENTGSIVSAYYSGGLAGFCCGCSFELSANRGAVSGSDYVGGVIGWSDDGADFGDTGMVNLLSRCMNTGAVTGEWGVGGIIGDAHDAVVSDCFNTGAVYSDDFAGGVTGYTVESAFSRCYNIGSVDSDGTMGAVVGRNSTESSSFENCLYLSGCCQAGDICAEARSEEQLVSYQAYPGFDFEGVWRLSAEGYPFARLEGVPEPMPFIGDTDGDGEVTVSDALQAMRCAMGIHALTPLERFRADTNANGSVEAADALTILRIGMGLI